MNLFALPLHTARVNNKNNRDQNDKYDKVDDDYDAIPIRGPEWTMALIRKESMGITSIAISQQQQLRYNNNNNTQATAGSAPTRLDRTGRWQELWGMRRLDGVLHRSRNATRRSSHLTRQDLARRTHNSHRRRMMEESQEFRNFQRDVATQSRLTTLATKQTWAVMVDRSVRRQMAASH